MGNTLSNLYHRSRQVSREKLQNCIDLITAAMQCRSVSVDARRLEEKDGILFFVLSFKMTDGVTRNLRWGLKADISAQDFDRMPSDHCAALMIIAYMRRVGRHVMTIASSFGVDLDEIEGIDSDTKDKLLNLQDDVGVLCDVFGPNLLLGITQEVLSYHGIESND